MAGRHAAPLLERTTHSTETAGHEVVSAPLPDEVVAQAVRAVPEAFTSRRARREAERAEVAVVTTPEAPVTGVRASTPDASAAVAAPPVLHFAPSTNTGSATSASTSTSTATSASTSTSAAASTSAASSTSSRAPISTADPTSSRPARATRRARRAPAARAQSHRAPNTPAREQHHPVSLRRAALLLAPVLAVTSGIALTSPAQADTLPQHFADLAQRTGQVYTVASDVQLPVVQQDGTTVISLPSLVVSGGASVGQAQATLRTALAAGGPRAKVLETALAYLGDTYVEGGASHQGIDCSGLTMVAYQSVGIQLAHYVPTQDAVATTISASEALPGDLVVYDDEDHVGLYLGDGLVLQAPHPGEPVDIIPMFSAAHHFARVLPA